MPHSWEEWRKDFHEKNPEVKPTYSNRWGVWHHDFFRERLTRDCGDMGRGWKRPSLDYKGPMQYDGGFSKAGLLYRGWTRTAIKRILGEPDWHLYSGFGKDRQVCMYSEDRVKEAEKGKIRFRQASEHKDLHERLFWKAGVRNARNYEDWPLPEGDPSAWLSNLLRWDFNWMGICHPWYVDRLAFSSHEKVLIIYVSHASRITWPCPKCARRCKLYDHRPEGVWLEGWLPICRVSRFDAPDRAVPAMVVGRLPRCHCPKHGPRSIRPLLPFLEAEGETRESRIEWVVLP